LISWERDFKSRLVKPEKCPLCGSDVTEYDKVLQITVLDIDGIYHRMCWTTMHYQPPLAKDPQALLDWIRKEVLGDE